MRNALCKLAGALGLVLATSVAAASTVKVSLDTSSLGVNDGFLELQLSAIPGTSLVTADLTNLVGFQSDDLQTSGSWGYTATPDGYRARNDVLNDLLFATHFGTVLSFCLEIDGAADPGYVTHFTASVWDAQFNALGDPSPFNASVLDLAWVGAAGAGTPGQLSTSYASGIVSLSEPSVSAVPEAPPSVTIIASLALIWLSRRRVDRRIR